jgi:hypothetical protein
MEEDASPMPSESPPSWPLGRIRDTPDLAEPLVGRMHARRSMLAARLDGRGPPPRSVWTSAPGTGGPEGPCIVVERERRGANGRSLAIRLPAVVASRRESTGLATRPCRTCSGPLPWANGSPAATLPAPKILGTLLRSRPRRRSCRFLEGTTRRRPGTPPDPPGRSLL